MNCEANKKESSKLLNGPSNDNQSTSSVSQISSSLMSISSKKHKNSSLSLNKRSPANPAHFLNTIKNSTLNVLSKPLNLSRSPSPQMNTRKQFKPIDLEANIIVNNKLDLIESSDDEEMDQYDENLGNEALSTIDELDLNSNNEARKDFVCKAVEESDSDSDTSTSNQDSVEQSKLNMCSCSKPSLKTLSYSNPNTSSSQIHIGKPPNNKFKLNQPISIIINDISKNAENLSPTTPLVLQDLEMKGQKIEPNEPLAPKSLNLPLKTILSTSNNKLLNNIDATNLLDIGLQNQTRQSVSFLDESNKTDGSRKDQNDSLVLGEYSKALDASDRLTLSPELGLSSSFTSSTINTGLTSSYSPSLMNRQFSSTSQVPIKVLHKTMTKGSKAMRIMGSSNTNGLANGYLKNCANDGVKGSGKRTYSSKKQHQKRLFFKNGNINISRCNIDKRRRRYLTDIFTTLIDLKWRYNILVFSLGFFISWSFFAFMWYMISYMHGDLEGRIQNKTVCISGINGLAGAILFSIETQQTIGYGVRFTTEKCPEAIVVMMVQSAVGVMIQSFMVGVVFAKLSRPKKRSETLMFSKNAVISLRDGRLCLICRVGDMRKSHIVEAHVRMYLIKKKVTLEGEIMPLHMYDLNVGWDKGLDRLFLVWPLTIEHIIDENSPFWTLSAEDLRKERFELAVILEGIVESTGMTTQARTSYLVNEILWGHRFEKLITFQKEDGTYKIDYSRFDMTVPIDTPTCSAKELAELREQENFFYYASFNDSALSSFNTNELRKRKIDEKMETDELKPNESEIKMV